MLRYYDQPFAVRVAVLILVLGGVALGDWCRHGPAATRWREYAFLLAAASVAAVFGALNDLVTVALSPEYFVCGKGLAPGPGLRWRAAGLGAQAGFVAGAVAAGMLLWADRGVARYRRLARRGVWVLLLALAGGGVAGAWVQPSRHRVFAIHTGLYLGALVGTVRGTWAGRRAAQRGRDAGAD